MFRKLRFRFIGIASLAVLFLIFSIVTVINSARYLQTKNQINKVLRVLSENDGSFPNVSQTAEKLGENMVSLDTISQYRYFSAVISDDDLLSIDTENISDLSDAQAENYAISISQSKDNHGDFDYQGHTYSYMLTKRKDGRHLLVVLDSTNQFSDNRTLIRLSVWMGTASFLFFVIVITVFSGKAIRPFVDNYEKQRRFITNASHELKTPLAVIAANNELVELMHGESEWTQNTSEQVQRLTGLLDGLVSLARLEEQEEAVLTNVNFSAVTEAAANDFKGPIIKDGKHFEWDIQPGVFVKAEEKSLFELVTLLVDNANKYCDEGGTVSVRLKKGSRLAKGRLEISNTYAKGKNTDYSKFFERFYRDDESHSSQKSGYGIGLSMAESLVKLFRGTISVSYKADTITFTVSL
ncbi:sensor histidine kinase [Streptococcus pantholopis]|uniref:histidine kinase n=1 Tax=Streptococcus pantholopis TaxID=1811193 RepID=A0A172Q6Y2_9STRE|nr:HAMP domain-containing sensor histidine kinase [Streptococcus pantholopis]AND79201.1 two-component sensor histidine kinase [Streptococcus pantholopis]